MVLSVGGLSALGRGHGGLLERQVVGFQHQFYFIIKAVEYNLLEKHDEQAIRKYHTAREPAENIRRSAAISGSSSTSLFRV